VGKARIARRALPCCSAGWHWPSWPRPFFTKPAAISLSRIDPVFRFRPATRSKSAYDQRHESHHRPAVRSFPGLFQPLGPQTAQNRHRRRIDGVDRRSPALADLTRTRIRRALRFYTGCHAYWKALAKGGFRYGLDGQPAGEVTPDQQAFARAPAPSNRPGRNRRQPPSRPRRGDTLS